MMGALLAPEQATADQSNPECDQQAREWLFLHLPAHCLDGFLALPGERAVKPISLFTEPLNRVLRRSLRDVIGAVLHMLHQPPEIALHHRDSIPNPIEIPF